MHYAYILCNYMYRYTYIHTLHVYVSLHVYPVVCIPLGTGHVVPMGTYIPCITTCMYTYMYTCICIHVIVMLQYMH